MAGDGKTGLHVTQIGCNTSDLAGTLRLFSDAFGFVSAGGNGAWGDTMKLQGLSSDDRALLWFMVGSQKYFNLEFIHHTSPVQRPKRGGWKASDHGWNRFGISVTDFDACLATLAANRITTMTPPLVERGLRRVAFIEPFIQVVVELFEKRAPEVSGPAIVYAASSVSDLEPARRFYRDVIGLSIAGDNPLHCPEHEALWGLAGAERDTFVAKAAGDVLVEVVEYKNPKGRPRPADYRMSDQGMVNISIGSREHVDVVGLIERTQAAGVMAPLVRNSDGFVCANFNVPEREFETSCVPEHLDAIAGLAPAAPFYSNFG